MQTRSYYLLMALSLLGIFFVIGCGEKENGSVVSEDQATGDTRTAQYKTEDGWNILGDYYEPKTKVKGVVVLLHQRGGSGTDWHPLSIALQNAGYIVFAIDQRGTGRSEQGPGQTGEFAPWDTSKDINGAVYAMKGKGPLTLVGASYGANNALIYAGAHPSQVNSLVLLSPGIDYHGLKTKAAAKAYTGPILLFHDKDDKIAGTGPAELDKASGSKDHQLQVMEGRAHGIALLNASTTQQIVDFVVRTLK